MDGKTIQCLPNPSQHVPIYLQSFPSYTMLKSKHRYFYHILVSPGDAPGAIMRNVVWMEREFDAYKSSRSMYNLSSTVSQLFELQVQKIAIFTYRSPHFCFPWRCLCDYHAYVASMERQFNACQTPRSMYLSIFNSFRVIRCLSQCVSPKIAIFTTVLFPLGMPWCNHAKCCMDGKRIPCLQIVSLNVPI